MNIRNLLIAKALFGGGGGGDTPTGTVDITANGIHDVKQYANANVNVPTGIFPTGTLDITENGEYDVTAFAKVIAEISDGLPDGIEIEFGDFIPLTTISRVSYYTIEHEIEKSPYLVFLFSNEVLTKNITVAYQGTAKSLTFSMYPQIKLSGYGNTNGIPTSLSYNVIDSVDEFSIKLFTYETNLVAGVQYNWIAFYNK